MSSSSSIGSLHHSGHFRARGRYDSGGEDMDGRTRLFKQDSSLVCGHGHGGAVTTFCWSGWAPTRPPRAWCFWCWWCGRRRRPGLALALRRGSLRALLRLFLSAAVHTFRLAGAQAWVAMVSFAGQLPGGEPVAERRGGRPSRPNSAGEDVERLYELSQEMMLHEDADRLIRDLPR
jgi:hypothetical protein